MASESPIQNLPPNSRWSDVWVGVSLPARALAFIFRSRRLVTLSAIASAVTAASLVALLWVLWDWTPALVNWVWHKPDAWAAAALWYLLVALVFVMLLFVGASTVPLLLLAPLQDPLSEATEAELGGTRAPRLSVVEGAGRTLRSLGHTALRVILLIAGHALLFGLNLIPAVGGTIWSVAATLWTMAWSAAEYLDIPMARYLYPFRDVRRTVEQRLPLCLGFGGALYVMLWIPVVNCFLIPVAVVAGTLLFRALDETGNLPRR